ncbi:PRAME family member 12-like [Sorex araneus]|uniref:PRAME family member 12-like n=1 Tax=Sorex araneus TaxID=42254 RepID=UPI00243409F4|nr:PRAME family member 12-like [Sorex araneus]
MRSLLAEEAQIISALQDLPVALLPQLFLEAYARRYKAALKVMVQDWPFRCLPLGCFIEDLLTEYFRINAVLDGLDALLTQKVRSRRCKLEILDLRHSPQKFWSQWCDVKLCKYSVLKRPMPEGSVVKKHHSASLEVLLDVFLMGGALDELSLRITEWARTRNYVHLCCKRLTCMDTFISPGVLSSLQLDCIQEVEARFTEHMFTFAMFVPLLGRMRRLQRLLLSVLVCNHTSTEDLNGQEHLVALFTSQLAQLHGLRELYLDSPVFLKGQLEQVLRCLRTPLETLSLTECPLLEQDMTHLCQCANLTQLKELSLRGTSLSLVREPLRLLLENCVSTLQDLDLGICGLQDSHLEAILPALKLCSQLSVLSFYGNRVSMATLVQMLRHLAGLPHLTLEVYPALQESYIAPNTLHQRTFDLLCAELRGVLRDLGKPRSILLSTMSCSCCGKIMFHNCEPMLFPVSCYNGLIQKISFPN